MTATAVETAPVTRSQRLARVREEAAARGITAAGRAGMTARELADARLARADAEWHEVAIEMTGGAPIAAQSRPVAATTYRGI